MPKGIVMADRYRPDFGLPFSPGWDDRILALPVEELDLLAQFKVWLDGRGYDITEMEMEDRLAKLGTAAAPIGMKFACEKNAIMDPIQFGWKLPSWDEVLENWQAYAVHVIMGGNRSSKSVFAARLFVWLLLTIPEARLRAYHVNDEKSVTEQQAITWEALPGRFKNFARKKGATHSIQFTQKNGFVGGKLIVPPVRGYSRGGELLFGTYQQYKNDPQVTEGWWAHAIWGDEEMPLPMFERLANRPLMDARGRLILTFTTIKGWTPLIADLLGRTRTLRSRYSSLMRKSLPVAQESVSRPGTRIYYFWTEDNPFIPPDSVSRLVGRPSEEILAVAHGIPSKPAMSKFPKFDPTVHVIAHDKLPWLDKVLLKARGQEQEPPEFTRYRYIDPSGAKPWFVVWFAVDAAENVYIYRESPSEADGMWAEPGEMANGRPGAAQKPNGWGIKDYVERMRHEEEGEVIFETGIDPRLGAATTQAMEGATSIISELDRAGVVAIPAPGLPIDHGLQLINDRLNYDQEKPTSALNHPTLWISERCTNVIWAFENYTGSGQEESCKDPIDCIRYALEAGICYIPEDAMSNPRRTFSY